MPLIEVFNGALGRSHYMATRPNRGCLSGIMFRPALYCNCADFTWTISYTRCFFFYLTKLSVAQLASNNWMTLSDESERMWEEAAVAYIKSITTLLFGRTEKP